MDANLNILNIEPRKLRPNPWNSNYVDPENEAKLLESIRRNGFYKPVICRELESGELEILGGQHRAAAAVELKIKSIPVVNLGRVDDKKAKAIGLADNGRYGQDDLVRLSEILVDIGEDASVFLPFSEKDLASLFSVADISLGDLDIEGEDQPSAADLAEQMSAKPTLTHELMRFKVPIEDAAAVRELLDTYIKAKGYSRDDDSLAAAGMALVDVCRAAKEGKA